MALYEVLYNNTLVFSKATLFSSILGILNKGTIIDVQNISKGYAQFNFNGKYGYVRTYTIKKSPEITGSIIIKYVDKDTQSEISTKDTFSNLTLGSYNYVAKSISGYNVYGQSSQTVTLTTSTPNQTITFSYSKIIITGSITIKYVDESTLIDVASPIATSNLSLGSYSYNAIAVPGYNIVEPKTQSITLTETLPNQTIIFKYKKIILGSITIKYIDSDTNTELASSKIESNLSLDNYTYEAISIDGYNISGDTSKTVSLTETTPNQTIIFKYTKVILGSVTIKYIDSDTNTELSSSKTESNLSLGSYTYQAISIDGYSISGDTSKTISLTETTPNQTIAFKYKKQVLDLYVIELNKFNIFNDNTNATSTTKGINDALNYAKQQGYKKVQLPAGNYLIENDNVQITKKFVDILDSTKTWSTNLKGIVIPDNIIFDITGCTLNLQPNKYAEQAVINFANSHNSQLIGGTILGDRDTHLFELVINNNADELESGDFDINTGLPITDTTKMRTKNYISTLSDGSPLPTSFIICPLANTSMNTVDGGCRYIYCYDENNNYLGTATGNNSFLTRATLPTNTAKIKVSFRGESRQDAKYYLSNEKVYVTYEQAFGIRIYASDNIIINGTTSNNFLTDGIITMPVPINHTNNNLTLTNCTFENNRRQGMSFVGTTDGALLQGCKFGNTQGVDPQCGVDLEHYSYVKNVVIDNCDFYDNKKWDIINYNGCDIEIKNCRFNGGIASTYGYNMNINHNKFVYYDNPVIDKTFKGGLFSLSTNQTGDVYFKIDSNYIEGYNSAGSTSTLVNSTFTNNTIKYSSMVIGTNALNNIYTNCSVRYTLCDYQYTGETLIDCVLSGDNNGSNSQYRYYNNFTLTNCEFKGGNPSVINTILKNCTIYNNSKSFCSTWSGKYTLDSCSITTEYTSKIPFISSQGIDAATFTNCTMNLSCTPFVALNYKAFYMNNCTITFNDSFKDVSTINFYSNVYGSATFDNNKFYKSFTNPKVVLPTSTNSYANDVLFTTSITL